MAKYNGLLDYNGWIDIEMHYNDNLDVIDGSDVRNFLVEMGPHIEEFNKYPSRRIEYKTLSWSKIYTIYGVHNHALNYLEDLLNLYSLIAEKAPGSYGLLYVRLSEDPVYWNKYRVFRMAKGVVTEHEDTLLSPCQPTIEE